VTDGVREVHEPVIEGPFSNKAAKQQAESEIGRLAHLERRHDLVGKLLKWIEDQLDLLAALLLERGNDFLERLALLRVVGFVPPDDELGGLSAERCQTERQSNENDLLAHTRSSLK
jgi:hypothetical protein